MHARWHRLLQSDGCTHLPTFTGRFAAAADVGGTGLHHGHARGWGDQAGAACRARSSPLRRVLGVHDTDRHPRGPACGVDASKRPCACARVQTHAHVYVYMRVHVHVREHAYLHARGRAHAYVHAHAHACLLHDRCRRAASSRWTWLPPTRAATPTRPSRQHPHAHSRINTHDCRLTRACPICDLVAPTPRVEETRPHSHAHMHLHACGDLPTALIFALTSV